MEHNSPMTSRKTALYLAGGALLVTYFAAANMPSPNQDHSIDRAPAPAAAAATLADEVQSQAVRLQARLAQAPTPAHHARNPFAFVAAPRPARAAQPEVRAAVVDEPAAAAIAPPPPLTLMGIAEEAIIGGFRRTAVIALGQAQTGDGDAILMVTEGQPVGDRYKVTRIGADAVELEDLLTKAYRRIALR